MRAKPIPISYARRAVIDLMHFTKTVPAGIGARRMVLQPLFQARSEIALRPSWPAIFGKALAVVARDLPELRRAYVTIPWPHLCEFPVSVGLFVIEREVEGEPVPLGLLIKDPAAMSILDIAANIRFAATAPVREIKHFNRVLQISRLPLPIRRLAWWIGLNWSRQRAHHFGTFAVSSVAGLGMRLPTILTPLTFALTYDAIEADGTMEVRLVFDHRVVDGAQVARFLVNLEQTLNGVVLQELQAMARQPGRPSAATSVRH